MSSMDPLQSWSGSADRVLLYKTNQSQLVREPTCTNIKGNLFVSLSVKMFFLLIIFLILRTGM